MTVILVRACDEKAPVLMSFRVKRDSVKVTPIIAVEERREALNRCVTRSSRCVGAKGIAVKERRVGAKSVRHTKLALRGRVKGIPIIAVEEGRRKSKSGRA
jgi:hypothetical protein